MEKTWKKARLWAVILSLCVIALGVVLIIWPESSALVVCIILGICSIGIGAVALVRYFKLGLYGIFFRYDLMIAIINILFGTLVLIWSPTAVTFMPIAVAIYMIMGSIIAIQLTVELYRFHGTGWVLSLICAIVGIAFAFLLLMDPFKGAAALMIVAGISLIVSSIQNLYLIFCISKTLKNGRNGIVVDAEWK